MFGGILPPETVVLDMVSLDQRDFCSMQNVNLTLSPSTLW